MRKKNIPSIQNTHSLICKIPQNEFSASGAVVDGRSRSIMSIRLCGFAQKWLKSVVVSWQRLFVVLNFGLAQQAYQDVWHTYASDHFGVVQSLNLKCQGAETNKVDPRSSGLVCGHKTPPKEEHGDVSHCGNQLPTKKNVERCNQMVLWTSSYSFRSLQLLLSYCKEWSPQARTLCRAQTACRV